MTKSKHSDRSSMSFAILNHSLAFLKDNLNFYRLHASYFVITPLVTAIIIWATSSVSYLDSLFITMSAMTQTGLSTVNLSILGAGHQAILCILMLIGCPPFVSLLTIMLRLHYFHQAFYDTIREQKESRRAQKKKDSQHRSLRSGWHLSASHAEEMAERGATDDVHKDVEDATMEDDDIEALRGHSVAQRRTKLFKSTSSARFGTIDKKAIRRLDGGGPGLMNPSGNYLSATNSAVPLNHEAASTAKEENAATGLLRGSTLAGRKITVDTQTTPATSEGSRDETEPSRLQTQSPVNHTHGVPLARPTSLFPTSTLDTDRRYTDYGGFPTPLDIFRRMIRKLLPKTQARLSRTLTQDPTATMTVTDSRPPHPSKDDKEYLSFRGVIERNSLFLDLSREQKDELGGVEYRALKLLRYIVLGYLCVFVIAGLVIITPYILVDHIWDDVFESQPRLVSIPWFALFQAVSAITNTGMSLVDTSLTLFQKAYLMNLWMGFAILAGHTGFPVFLRLTVWLLWKCLPTSSTHKHTLRFLLDHPRRCYIYMFPPRQTHMLAFAVFCLTMFDFTNFMILDIGTPYVEAIPVGTRIAAGLVQAIAVRHAGFTTVVLSSLAPAVQVLFVIMMYIAVFPVALAVRSTNVYEDQALGVYSQARRGHETSPGDRMNFTRNLSAHIRKQIAFDAWWLALCLWLICIIERGAISNPDSNTYLNVFAIIFEVVSGNGNVGLSLGVSYDNFSLVGSFRKLSKFVMILVMLRGRHRALPFAVDRAVLLPKDFDLVEDQPALEHP